MLTRRYLFGKEAKAAEAPKRKKKDATEKGRPVRPVLLPHQRNHRRNRLGGSQRLQTRRDRSGSDPPVDDPLRHRSRRGAAPFPRRGRCRLGRRPLETRPIPQRPLPRRVVGKTAGGRCAGKEGAGAVRLVKISATLKISQIERKALTRAVLNLNLRKIESN